MCEGLHKDSGARCRSDVLWKGLLRDHVWCDDGGPGMTQNLAELAEGTYMWWCSEPTICLWQCHWTDRDRDRVDCVIWNVTVPPRQDGALKVVTMPRKMWCGPWATWKPINRHNQMEQHSALLLTTTTMLRNNNNAVTNLNELERQWALLQAQREEEDRQLVLGDIPSCMYPFIYPSYHSHFTFILLYLHSFVIVWLSP